MSQPCSSAMSPKSPKETRFPRVAGPFMTPRWDFRNFTRLGINMAVLPELRLGRRDRRRLLLLLFELLALVDPHLHADRSLAQDRGGGPVVDVGPERVERDAAQHQPLLPRDFRAAQAALGQH